MSILRTIEAHLKRTGLGASTFGKAAVGDPNLVRNLRNGRELRSRTEARVRAYLEANAELPQAMEVGEL